MDDDEGWYLISIACLALARRDYSEKEQFSVSTAEIQSSEVCGSVLPMLLLDWKHRSSSGFTFNPERKRACHQANI